MRVEIEIPPKEQTLRDGCQIPLAGKGVTWKQSCLGKKAKDIGVYVIHHGGRIKYVGKTGSPATSFGTRLRREFQEGSASGLKHIHPKLASLASPPPIMVSLFSPAGIEKLVLASELKLNIYEAINIFETVLIQAYRPDFQRHHERQTAVYMEKAGIANPAAVVEAARKLPVK